MTCLCAGHDCDYVVWCSNGNSRSGILYLHDFGICQSALLKLAGDPSNTEVLQPAILGNGAQAMDEGNASAGALSGVVSARNWLPSHVN